MKTIQLNYVFENPSSAPIQLWLALPSMDAHHPGLALKLSRDARETHALAENTVAYFELAQGEVLQMDCEFDAPVYPLQQELSAEMRAFYLRSTTLITLNDKLKNYANQQVAVAADALTQARQLFLHVVEHYQFDASPTQRGAQSMLQLKRGDSSEFAFLYAALCRARNIPCRVVFGAFANGTMSAHSWNEIYIDQQGWLPVDCSMAKRTQSLWRSMMMGMTVLPWQAYFGALEGPRVVFSLDCDLPVKPAYHQHPAPSGASMRIGEQYLHWGLELLNGHIPYLHPAYVRLDASFTQPAHSLRERISRARLYGKLLGNWRANHRGNWRYPLQKTWSFALYLYCGEILVSWAHPQPWLADLRSSTATVVLGLSGVLLLWQIVTSARARRQFD